MILYFCPDIEVASAGFRLIYRHVDLLNRGGIAAAILHRKPGFRMPDAPNVPVKYLESPQPFSAGDCVVIPECLPDLMQILKPLPIRRFVIELSWKYVYDTLIERVERRGGGRLDWRDFGIELIITNSPYVEDFVKWAMPTPCRRFQWGINRNCYFFDPNAKRPKIAYVKRKEYAIPELIRLLESRNPAFTSQIEWTAMHGLGEADYAWHVRQSSLFLNLSEAEGLPSSLLEAMESGTFVAGYNSVGAQHELIGSGDSQNCILAENLDFPTLARRMEPLLTDIIAGDLRRWEPMRKNALATAAQYTTEAEQQSVLSLWAEVLRK